MITNVPAPVIIDTDFGGDPDDIIALLYAVTHNQIEVRAIVSADEYQGNYRALALKHWLSLQELDTPVFIGNDLGNADLFYLQDIAQRSEYSLEHFRKSEQFNNIFMNVVKEQGVVLGLGGCSNLATLLEMYPEEFLKLKVVVMGGAINYRKPGTAEHNIRVDVTAASTVFHSQLDISWVLSDTTFTAVNEVTKGHRLYTHFFESSHAHEQLVKTNIQRFFTEKFPGTCMHDPLTLSSLFLNSITFREEQIEFKPNGEFVMSDTGKKTKISSAANYDLFWQDLYKTLGVTK